MAAPCCYQFIASGDRIRAVPLPAWRALLEAGLAGGLAPGAQACPTRTGALWGLRRA